MNFPEPSIALNQKSPEDPYTGLLPSQQPEHESQHEHPEHSELSLKSIPQWIGETAVDHARQLGHVVSVVSDWVSVPVRWTANKVRAMFSAPEGAGIHRSE
ncbi:hypothetical protein BLNAU_16250 [Blattamonas nauphoetae]|uniref:Uncharacterized protein n=1 Tax=Blattamonas nauphoetae TaxID=2049346 RepID=A0ABQ9XC11_9EUKA|nr:hypothetical protein BLNAU_16248 [Blattamonas nauphoetae]KAK2948800.1 hypothetical protein BLNAU_16250 [Blattamonas nauphoetae]